MIAKDSLGFTSEDGGVVTKKNISDICTAKSVRKNSLLLASLLLVPMCITASVMTHVCVR